MSATDRLRSRGLVDDDGFTEDGRRAREEVEVTTYVQCRPLIDVLGDDVERVGRHPHPVGNRDPLMPAAIRRAAPTTSPAVVDRGGSRS